MTNKGRKAKVSNILKTKGVLHFDSNKNISAVLPELKSSHDAAFVFGEKDKFLGVISTYYLFKARSASSKTKLKSLVKMPPKLDNEMSLSETARRMIESKVYFLPVMEGKEFLGIATINRLFEFVSKNKLINRQGRIIFSSRSLVVIEQNESISHGLEMMKKEKIAKLPVINHKGVLVGVISQYDLKEVVEDETSAGKGDKKKGKKTEHNIPIRQYMKRNLVTVNRLPSFYQAAEMMMQRKVGSLIVVDKNNKPISIVTKRDLLKTIVEAKI
jgi:predicted transcriptional regulator